MSKLSLLVAVIAGFAVVPICRAAESSSARVPVLLELFTSEGCSSCPPARQHDYTNRYNLGGVYTPQLVVDGRYGFVGSDGKEASAAIQKAIRERKIPIAISNLARNGNQVTARIELPAGENLKGASGILYVALADNRQESHVARGENGGHTLSHVAVTRVLKQVGPIDLGASVKEIVLPIQQGSGNGLRLVAFIQDSRSGRVLGVAQQKL
jgi:hypothetical protein